MINTNRILALVHLPMGPLGLQTHSMVVSLVSKSIIGTDALSTWQRSHAGSLTDEVRKGRYARNGQVEASEIDQLLTSCTDHRSNQKHSPGEIAEVSAFGKDLKDVRVMVSAHLRLIYLGGPCKKPANTGPWW